ncbi:hypothetical protein ACTWP5_00295 [Streptomyces sp. 4N509B]|uniref:hypothetical protein n=1 Tax=Streptomyces sp. 4N509B TaxID=3457413 RepID=UPI003FD1E6DE
MVRRDGIHPARFHALAVLRVRDGALALALLPAAVAVVLAVGGAPPVARWSVAALAALVLALAVAVAAVTASSRPAVTPTVRLSERAAPALHELVRELAERLDVPPPGAVALTPDCDMWLEEPAPGAGRQGGGEPGPTLVIGSPFLWWMRVGELRALLAPVVAGTGPSAHPDIAAARRLVRAWDATITLAAGASAARHPARRLAALVARRLLRAAGSSAGEMERAVAGAASARAQTVDYGLRIVAQEQVGLAYAGWDRLLTRVALPAWRTGRWPRHLDAGVVAALTELSRRDRLAEGFAVRLAERPASELLRDPVLVDEEISLLAARLFHGIPEGEAGEWEPVDWQAYPDEVVERLWRDRAARLFAALDVAETPTLACAVDRLAQAPGDAARAALAARLGVQQAVAAPPGGAAHGASPPGGPPLFPLQPPRSEQELLAEHLAAAICCAATDTTAAAPGLDWLDGPVLVADGRTRHDLRAPVHSLVDDGDPGPLRAWFTAAGIRPDKPIRLL